VPRNSIQQFRILAGFLTRPRCLYRLFRLSARENERRRRRRRFLAPSRPRIQNEPARLRLRARMEVWELYEYFRAIGRLDVFFEMFPR
jgi:hypothetical protein